MLSRWDYEMRLWHHYMSCIVFLYWPTRGLLLYEVGLREWRIFKLLIDSCCPTWNAVPSINPFCPWISLILTSTTHSEPVLLLML